MPAIEEELLEAISYRNEMAVELGSLLLRLASENGESEPQIIRDARGIINGGYGKFATDIEALTAVILQRAGVSWDVLAAPTEVSKQALHRRLGPRGEALFATALQHERETDPRALTRSLRKAERADDWRELFEVLTSMPYQSRELIENLVRLPKPRDILTAPTQFAVRLSELRKIPRWWGSLE
jgi:hypothetical protein